LTVKRYLIAVAFVGLLQPHLAQATPLTVVFSMPTIVELPMVEGTTNLPDGIDVTVSLQTPVLECRPNYRIWESKTTVKDGRFVAGPFTAEPGTYKLEIKTGLAELDSAQVRAVIGPHGENLRGPYVKPEIIPGYGPTVDYLSQVTVVGR
jgi:hypothetical protein